MNINLKNRIFGIVLIAMVLIIIVGVGELLIRTIRPQNTLYPRWKFSEKYGAVLFENTQMVHEQPGRWKFIYTINEYQYRGKLIPISNKYEKKNVVILGDSYAFGTGVNDGDEFAAIMAEDLKDDFNVINLSVGGWGLAQQIRRYYEFGQLYSPEIVLLQFCNNDPNDNFKNRVTSIENGTFKFKNSNNTLNWVKKYLSKSIIQKSQIYNSFRDTIYRIITKKIIRKDVALYKGKNEIDSKILPEEKFYNELLEVFAKDLKQKGIKLIMISVNNQLNEFPNIKAKIFDLSSSGLIKYYEVASWLKDVSNYGSPEGHMWGEKAHYIIGRKLSGIIELAQ